MKLRARTTDGQEWEVVRPALPWRPRSRGDSIDLGTLPFDDFGDDPISGIVMAVLLFLLVLLLLPIILLLGEVLLLLPLVPIWFLGRWLGFLRWRVKVVRDGDELHSVLVRGTRRSREVAEEFAARISRSTDKELVGTFTIEN